MSSAVVSNAAALRRPFIFDDDAGPEASSTTHVGIAAPGCPVERSSTAMSIAPLLPDVVRHYSRGGCPHMSSSFHQYTIKDSRRRVLPRPRKSKSARRRRWSPAALPNWTLLPAACLADASPKSMAPPPPGALRCFWLRLPLPLAVENSALSSMPAMRLMRHRSRPPALTWTACFGCAAGSAHHIHHRDTETQRKPKARKKKWRLLHKLI